MDAVISAPLEIDQIVRTAQDDLEQAIQRGGLARDPMRFPLRALSSTLDAMHRLHRAEQCRSNGVRAAVAAEASAAVERAKAEMHAAEAVTIERIALSIAASADKALTRKVRVFDRNTALFGALMVLAVAASAVGGGYLWGHRAAQSSAAETEAGLSAAFRNGPDAAQRWLSLIQANDPAQVIANCSGPDLWVVADGRRACRAALWLDPPQRAAPAPGIALSPVNGSGGS